MSVAVPKTHQLSRPEPTSVHEVDVLMTHFERDPMMVPQHLRVLAYFFGSTGWVSMDLRTLSLETGLDYRYMTLVLDALERTHLLEIQHGRSDADPDGPLANSYRITDRGRRCVPEVLQQPLTGNYALNHPMWSYKGYNLHGLVVALHLGPGVHEVDSATIAKALGTNRRSAVKRLATWGLKGWAQRVDRSTYTLFVPQAEPEVDMIDIEGYVPEKANQSAERKRAWVYRSREAKKVVQKVIEEFGHYAPAALRKVREACVEMMIEFVEQVTKPLKPPRDLVREEATMAALRSRGTRSHV